MCGGVAPPFTAPDSEHISLDTDAQHAVLRGAYSPMACVH
jgi:hypothetical protein